MAKNFRVFLENLFEYYFLNIMMNVNFFNDSKFEYCYEYYPEILLQESHAIFKSMVSGAKKFS